MEKGTEKFSYAVNNLKGMIFIKHSKIAVLLIAFVIFFSAFGGGQPVKIALASDAAQTVETEKWAPPSLKDDFYENMNYEWLSTAVIPGDQSRTGSFSVIQNEIDLTLRNDLKDMRDSEEKQEDPAMQNMVEFYRLVSDFEARNKAGFTQIEPRLKRVEAINSIADLNKQYKELTLDNFNLPFTFYVMSDSQNSSINSLYVYPPSPFLGSRVYYEEAKETGDFILEIRKEFVFKMFKLAGYSEKDAQKHWDNAMALDELIVPLTYTEVEASNPAITNNPTDFKEFTGYGSNIDFNKLVMELCGKTPDKINVYSPKFMKAIDEIYNDETFDLFKSVMLISEVTGWSSYLTEEIRQLTGEMGMKLSGSTEIMDADKAAFYIAEEKFSELIGQYYGKKYFGVKARADVTQMVEKTIAVYRNRLLKNDWLEQETIDMAVRKLDAMKINVGWPDKLPEEYALYIIKPWADGGNVIDNLVAMGRVDIQQMYKSLDNPVDKDLWGINASVVNAFYSPWDNAIYFPSGILSAPFYSTEQSDSENLGGIGVVIGHEITHAFDASGSQYDETGSMNNWWTEADKAEFEKRTEAAIKLFDGVPFMEIKVNGDLTKTENVADAGGVSCALEITKSLPDGDVKAFFENYAKTWKSKETKEFAAQAYVTDSHSPPKVRVNVQLGNCNEFYSVYGIKEGDGMYIPPEKRVKIW